MAQIPEYSYCPKKKSYRDYLKEAAKKDPKNYGYYAEKISKKSNGNYLIIKHD